MHAKFSWVSKKLFLGVISLLLSQVWVRLLSQMQVFPSLFPSRIAVSECVVDAAQGGLFPGEAASVSGAVEKRRREFIAGRTCARRALAMLGGPLVEIPVGVQRAPLWPAGYVGSIAHAEGRVAAAVGLRAEFDSIGMDLEGRGRVTADLFPMLFVAQELEWLAGRRGTNEDAWPTVLFCAKEAFYKYQYPLTGWFVDFKEVRVTVDVETNAFRVEWVSGRLQERRDVLECEGRIGITPTLVYATAWKSPRI